MNDFNQFLQHDNLRTREHILPAPGRRPSDRLSPGAQLCHPDVTRHTADDDVSVGTNTESGTNSNVVMATIGIAAAILLGRQLLSA